MSRRDLSPGPYAGRFAPSPTGALHAGSLVAALASWLDARAHRGRWLVRIEDIDTPRCVPGAARTILRQLADCQLLADAPPLLQSTRTDAYQAALDRLLQDDLAYPCSCTRKEIADALAAQHHAVPRNATPPYPGTCRHGLNGKPARAWRLRLPSAPGAARVAWIDRRLGEQVQDVSTEVGDFVLKRADGLWAYQLAVVVDDAAQGITHVVRGEDLADNTPRQLLLQRALGLAAQQYLHTPLVLGADGEKLSKQNGAAPVDTSDALAALRPAAAALGLAAHDGPVADALAAWTAQWRAQFPVSGAPASLQFASDMSSSPPTAPAHVAHPRAIRSFVLRAGRTTTGQARAFETLGPRFLLPYTGQLLDPAQAFGRVAPTVLEIGFGMGEATAHIAALMPGTNFLCCEVHEPGVGALLLRIGEKNLDNIRIVQHDAVEVMDHMLADGSLDGVHLFFPDPWHKTRHHKRRLVQPPLVARLARKLVAGGTLHFATDWQPYAVQMLEVLQAEPLLVNTADTFAPKPSYRPLTKFENRGLKLGHGVWDLVFKRR